MLGFSYRDFEGVRADFAEQDDTGAAGDAELATNGPAAVPTSDFTFIGLTAMQVAQRCRVLLAPRSLCAHAAQDPPRERVADAVAACHVKKSAAVVVVVLVTFFSSQFDASVRASKSL